MLKLALQKLLYGLSLLFGVVSLVFVLFAYNPADPARMLGGQFADALTLASIRAEYGLDKPVFDRYLLYLKNLSPIGFSDGVPILKSPDLGISYHSGKAVVAILGESIPNSLILAGAAIGLALLLGVVMGVFAALHKDQAIDRLLIAVSALGMAGPSFFVGMLISWLFGYKWSENVALNGYVASGLFALGLALLLLLRKKKTKAGYFIYGGLMVAGFLFMPSTINLPGSGLPMTGSLFEIHPFLGRNLALEHLILPTLTLGIRPLSVFMQLTRNSLLEVLQMDYIRTAYSKGLSSLRVILVHALPGALNPVITAASGWFAGMLAGAVFVEFIFGWRGLGLELFEALQREDQPVVMGAVLFFAAFFVIVNIVVDLIYAGLDPRIRLRKA